MRQGGGGRSRQIDPGYLTHSLDEGRANAFGGEPRVASLIATRIGGDESEAVDCAAGMRQARRYNRGIHAAGQTQQHDVGPRPSGSVALATNFSRPPDGCLPLRHSTALETLR